jgi:putative FmdB family regulatory protein
MIYEYECPECGLIEVARSMRDEPLRECPECGSPIRRIYRAPGVVWKGNFRFMRGEPEVDMDALDREQNKRKLKRAKARVHDALAEPPKQYFYRRASEGR